MKYRVLITTLGEANGSHSVTSAVHTLLIEFNTPDVAQAACAKINAIDDEGQKLLGGVIRQRALYLGGD